MSRMQSKSGLAAVRGLLMGTLVLAACQRAHAQETLPPANSVKPAASSTPVFGLVECIQMGVDRQPALAALRASLSSSEIQAAGLASLPKLPLLSPDLAIRRKQSCLGVTIAQAGLDQAYWETVYTVTRMYFTVLYARAQANVLREDMKTFELYRDIVERGVKSGGPGSRSFTDIDVGRIRLHVSLVKSDLVEAEQGEKRALASLAEAIGLEPCGCFDVVGELSAHPRNVPCCGDLVSLALARRGEIVQVVLASQVTELEVAAQNKVLIHPVWRTFASTSDIHARPVPQGHANREYWPGATGLEMPPFLAGPHWARVDRAHALSDRAAAVVEKTRNLITLETEDAYFKWQAAERKLPQTTQARQSAGEVRAKTQATFRGLSEGGVIDLRVTLNDLGDARRADAAHNEALYLEAIELAALQRVTAGGFDPCFEALAAATSNSSQH
jgi:outer membrane protein TolC